MSEINHTKTERIVCPYCGYTLNSNQALRHDKCQCSQCGNAFKISAKYFFDTEKIETITDYCQEPVDEIIQELKEAVEKHGRMNTLYEAVSVIREEYLEFEKYVFWGKKNGLTVQNVREEAVQIAAMALETIILIDKNELQLK
jgi:DNA-directed RNA polymerase subunit RPC12/RpoP